LIGDNRARLRVNQKHWGAQGNAPQLAVVAAAYAFASRKYCAAASRQSAESAPTPDFETETISSEKRR
jgi:hypothetical protein